MGRFQSDLTELIQQYQLHFRHLKWKEALFMIEEGFYSQGFCEMLLPEARHDAERVIDQGNFLPRAPTEDELYAEGKPDIELGTLIEGEGLRIGIRLRDRPRNVLIVGGAGSGKTVTCRNLCIAIDRLNELYPDRPILLVIIDPKGDFSDLPKILRGQVRLYCPQRNLRFGTNGPTDVPPTVWIGQLTLSLAHRLGLVVSRTYLAAIIVRLLVALNPGLEQPDLQDVSVNRQLVWPPLKMVLEVSKRRDILDAFSSKADYGKTLIQTLEGLMLDSGDLFDCCNGFDLNAELASEHHCVFNVSNVPPYVTHILSDTLINQVLVSRLYNDYKCDHTDLVFLIDECDLLVESDVANFKMGMSPLDRLHRLGRELGLMSVISISGIQNGK